MKFYLWNVVAGATSLIVLSQLEKFVAKRRGVELYSKQNSSASWHLLLIAYVSIFIQSTFCILLFSRVGEFAPWHLGPFLDQGPQQIFTPSFFALFLLDDLLYYFVHRLQHSFRPYWRVHQAHHSSRYYNILVAARISILDFGLTAFWPLLALLGFDVHSILYVHCLNIQWNILLHSEFAPKLGFLERVLMTPANHRIHHASNPEYYGKNLGGMLIIWDRLFGTYSAELATAPLRYEVNSLTGRESAREIITHGLPWMRVVGFFRRVS